jgi:hypothetical protein
MNNVEKLLRNPELLELSNYSFAKNNSLASFTYVAGAGAVSYGLDAITCSVTVDNTTLTEVTAYGLDPINVSVTVDDATIVATDPHALTGTDISVSSSVDTSTCAENVALHPTTENWSVQVLDQSGSNVFYLGPAHLDGDYRPILQESNLPWMIQRGTTYVFDVSHSSNSGHPFRFRDENDNSYTTGVTVSGTEGTSGATVTFAVPLDAPDTLKYYCTVHGNAMGNFIYPSYRDVTVDTVSVDSSTIAVADGDQLTSSDISVSVNVDTPDITVADGDQLTSTDISCVSSVDDSSISQSHNLNSDQIGAGIALDRAIITQIHDLSLDQINVSVSVDDSIYVENVALTSDDITTSAASIDDSSISQIHNLLSLAINCGCIVDNNRILGFADIIDIESSNIQDALILESLEVQEAIVIDQITDAYVNESETEAA